MLADFQRTNQLVEKTLGICVKKTPYRSCQYHYHAEHPYSISSVEHTDCLVSTKDGTTSYFWENGLPIQNIFPIFVSNIS